MHPIFTEVDNCAKDEALQCFNGGVCVNGCPQTSCQCGDCWTGDQCEIRKILLPSSPFSHYQPAYGMLYHNTSRHLKSGSASQI